MLKKKSFKEITFLWLGSLSGALAAFLTQVLLAREIGPAGFGSLASLLTIVALLTPMAGFGVAQYWLKVYGAEGVGGGRWLPGSFRFIFISTLGVLGVLSIWAFSGLNDATTKVALLIMSVFLLSQVVLELVSARLQLEERYLTLAIWQLTPHLTRLILLVAIAYTSVMYLDLLVVVTIYSLVGCVVLFVGVMQLVGMYRGNWRLKGFHGPNINLIEIRPGSMGILKNSWPFGLASFFHLIYYQSDIVLLKYIVGPESAGIYNVGFTILAAVYLLPGVVYQKYLLPKLHRWSNHDSERFYQVYKFGIKAMMVLGVSAMLALWLTSFWMIPLLFGQEYLDSVMVVNLLALSVPLVFLAFNSGATLVTRNNMRRKVMYMGYVAVFNVALNVVLIPLYAEFGAALSTVLSNALLLFMYYIGTNKYVFKKSIGVKIC